MAGVNPSVNPTDEKEKKAREDTLHWIGNSSARTRVVSSSEMRKPRGVRYPITDFQIRVMSQIRTSETREKVKKKENPSSAELVNFLSVAGFEMKEQTVMEGGGGGETMEKGNISNVLNVSNTTEKSDVIQELIDEIESFSLYRDFRRTQRRDSFNLVRRMKLLVPLLEEIGKFDGPIPDAAFRCLCDLKKTFLHAKILFKCCLDGSKIYLAFEDEEVKGRFGTIYDKMSQALEGMPYDELGMSDEVKEQVVLMRLQSKRASRRLRECQDIELVMDMMEVEKGKADSAILEKLAKKLELDTVADLKAETVAIRKLVEDRAGQNAESTQRILYILSKFKQTVGLEENIHWEGYMWYFNWRRERKVDDLMNGDR